MRASVGFWHGADNKWEEIMGPLWLLKSCEIGFLPMSNTEIQVEICFIEYNFQYKKSVKKKIFFKSSLTPSWPSCFCWRPVVQLLTLPQWHTGVL